MKNSTEASAGGVGGGHPILGALLAVSLTILVAGLLGLFTRGLISAVGQLRAQITIAAGTAVVLLVSAYVSDR
ncbi:MAG: hypothetical protein ABEI98_00595 [Halorhabdus sp.]